jgi:hypothetical protein
VFNAGGVRGGVGIMIPARFTGSVESAGNDESRPADLGNVMKKDVANNSPVFSANDARDVLHEKVWREGGNWSCMN